MSAQRVTAPGANALSAGDDDDGNGSHQRQASSSLATSQGSAGFLDREEGRSVANSCKTLVWLTDSRHGALQMPTRRAAGYLTICGVGTACCTQAARMEKKGHVFAALDLVGRYQRRRAEAILELNACTKRSREL